MSIERLTFIYDADGTLAGELKYFFGSLVGSAHCALCDITHNRVKKRAEFIRCADRLALPIEYLHRDQLSPTLKTLTTNNLPCVVGHAELGDVILIGKHELETLGGDLAAFETHLVAALGHQSG
jgi:hypothetical protein